MNTLSQKMKEEVSLWAADRFEVYVILTFDSKFISKIWIAEFYLHPMGNHCAKYMNILSNKIEGVQVKNSKTDFDRF